MAGPDDLLLLLVQLWARDQSVFPTEDDRHDFATIMLFQSYTGGRPAEFVHSSKGRASQDPLGEDEELYQRKTTENNHKNESDADDGLEYDDDSDAGDGPEYDDDALLDSDDERSVDDNNKGKDGDSGPSSGYNSDGTDATMTEDTTNHYTTKVNEIGEPVV